MNLNLKVKIQFYHNLIAYNSIQNTDTSYTLQISIFYTFIIMKI